MDQRAVVAKPAAKDIGYSRAHRLMMKLVNGHKGGPEPEETTTLESISVSPHVDRDQD